MAEEVRPPLAPQKVYSQSWTGTSAVINLYDPDVVSGTREIVFFVSNPTCVLFFSELTVPSPPITALTGWLAPGFTFRHVTIGPDSHQMQAVATQGPATNVTVWWYFPGESV